MAKDHYLPEVYLTEFTNYSKQFWRFDINSEHKQRPKLSSPAAVCYGKNFYTIDSQRTLIDYGLSDYQHIEKKTLKQFEDRYGKVVKIIKEHKKFIITKQAKQFIKGLLLTKIRNKYVREKLFNKEVLGSIYDKQIRNTQHIIAEFEKELGLELLKPLQDYKNLLISSELHQKDTHLQILLDLSKTENETTNTVVDFLLNSSWFIFTTSPSNPFITSDNPGFCIDEHQRIQNLALSGNFSFIFPLTPLHALCIVNKYEDKDIDELCKFIHYRNASSKIVRIANQGAIEMSNKQIYSHSKEVIEYWIKNESISRFD